MPSNDTDTSSKPKSKGLLIGVISGIVVLAGVVALVFVITLPKPSAPATVDVPTQQITYEVLPIIPLAELDTTQKAAFDALALINRGMLATEDALPQNPNVGDTYYVEVTNHYYTLYNKEGKSVWIDTGEAAQNEIGEVIPDTNAATPDTPKTIPSPATPTAPPPTDPNAGKVWHAGYWETVVDAPAWTESIYHKEVYDWVDIWVCNNILFLSYAEALAYVKYADVNGIPHDQISSGKQNMLVGYAYTEYINHPAVTHEVWHEGYWE